MAADIILREVTLDDAQFLYDLLAQRPAHANISHRVMPSWESHCHFIRSRPYTAWYVIIRHTLVGSCYLTTRDEIGIHVLPNHHRQGIASASIHSLMKLHPRDRYLANIAPGNASSIRMFQTIGFRPLQLTYELRP